MARTVAIGIQDFSDVIRNGYLYIDKTSFIREWWDSGDSVTLITRPRRFGKTLAMSMVEHFFSVRYSGEGNLFEDLDIWKDEKYRKLQGAYPVISLSEQEVFAALDECGRGTEKEKVKTWYDGFCFGNYQDIYNPWSILNFLDTGKYRTYWANTSSNSLVSKLLRESSRLMKEQFEELLCGHSILTPLDEQVVYNQLDQNESAVWSLLLAGGYLKVLEHESEDEAAYGREPQYRLALTNYEVLRTFAGMVRGWFRPAESDYNDFVKALLLGDTRAMNVYMNRVALQTFSYFDTGNRPGCAKADRRETV